MKRYLIIIGLLLSVCGLCRAQKLFQPDNLCLFEYSNDTIRQSVEVSLLNDCDTLYVERIEGLDDNRDILYINRNGEKQLVYELFTTDCSSIDYIGSHQENGKRIFDCYSIYNNAADGNHFLFYDYRNSTVYLTKACFFSSFRLLMSSVDFNKRQVLLENDSCIPNQTDIDTLDVGNVSKFITDNARIIKASFDRVLTYDEEYKTNQEVVDTYKAFFNHRE